MPITSARSSHNVRVRASSGCSHNFSPCRRAPVPTTRGSRPSAPTRKILALAEMHGAEAVARALDDGLELEAFSAEYIAHMLAARRRIGAEPAALQLTRRQDLLDLELPAPDLSIYEERDDDANTP